MCQSLLRTVALMWPALTAAAASAQTAPAIAVPLSRGQALYETHCIACHDAQIHWRDARRATDWDSLKREVRRWQSASALPWSEADVVQVARYLNDSFYRYPQTSDLVGRAGPARARP